MTTRQRGHAQGFAAQQNALPLTTRIERMCTPEPNTGCWLWTGQLTSHGYGWISVRCRRKIASRVSHRAFIGPIPDGLFVLHRCDQPSCVNPAHLFLGTKADNTADMMRKGRHVKGLHATIDMEIARAIRGLSAGGMHVTAIAKQYGIARETARAVIVGISWKEPA